MLTEICQEIKNWFVKSEEDKHIGTFKISDGIITPSIGLKENQYYKIVGSVFNDSVHKYGDPSDDLKDEEFDGAIWIMYVPAEVVSIATEVENYISEYGKVTPFQSESFGGYSYTRGDKTSWQSVFSSVLNKWRKI